MMARVSTGNKIAIGLAVALIAGAAFLLGSGKWGCWWSLERYVPKDSVYVRVDRGKEERFHDILRQTARRHDMWFALDSSDAAVSLTGHAGFAAQLFSCSANVIANNPHGRELYGVHFARAPSATDDEFDIIRKELISRIALEVGQLHRTPEAAGAPLFPVHKTN